MQNIAAYSTKRVQWKCEKCGKLFITRVQDRTNYHSGCPSCNTIGTSFSEQYLYFIIKQIFNNAENRFNSERPEVDSELLGRDTSIYSHRWKNLFFLKDYQRFFSKGLKGKISNNNYYLMQKKFMEIYNICFGEGRELSIKPIERNTDKLN